jgi:hypothetical protein
VPYGNHAREFKFVVSLDTQSSKMMNEVCVQIPVLFWKIGYHVSSLADLEQGKDFAIVELNGAASEPTHI